MLIKLLTSVAIDETIKVLHMQIVLAECLYAQERTG